MTDVAAFVLARLAEREQAAEGTGLIAWERQVLVEVAALRAVAEDMSFYWRKYPEGLAAKELADRTLRALAGIWAGHPDYDPAWKVET